MRDLQKGQKMEKNTSKTRDDIRRLFENQVAIMNHLSYYTLHNQVHTNWQTSALSLRLNLAQPTDIPSNHQCSICMFQIFHPLQMLPHQLHPLPHLLKSDCLPFLGCQRGRRKRRTFQLFLLFC